MFSHLSRFVTPRALAGAISFALAGTVSAADPLPPAAPVVPVSSPPPRAGHGGAPKPVAIADVALSRAVLAALDADPRLKDVNLIVSVVDRGAVIGGPVATEDIRKHAEKVVRGVAGVESVKNVCFVSAAPEPLLRAAAEGLKPAPKPLAAALPGVTPPPDRHDDGFIPPLAPLPPGELVVNGPKAVETLRPSASSVPPVNVLGGPVAAAGTGAVVKVNPLPTVAAPEPAKPLFPTAPATPAALSSAPYPDVPTAVAALRKKDAFARLDVKTMPDGGILVVGSAAKASDVWDFVTELRKVPGVTRIAPSADLVK